jgi:steroid delta-isomerase-like uncharacterized protein
MKWQAKALLVLLLFPFVALAQQQTQTETSDLPPGPTSISRSVLEAQTLTGQFDLVQIVLEFAPGAWTPLHTHGGEGIVTVLEGEITVRMEDGTENTYTAGEFWVEHSGEYAEVGNAGDEVTRAVAVFILPEGAELTTVQGSTDDEEGEEGEDTEEEEEAMSGQQVLEVLRANSTAMNAQAMDRYMDTFTEDLVWEGDSLPAPVVGPAAAAETMNVFYTAFPDLHFEVQREFASGDQGVVCYLVTGTHQGDFLGIAPTGQRVEYNACAVFQVRDGKIARVWTYLDSGHILRQLGVMPASDQ